MNNEQLSSNLLDLISKDININVDPILLEDLKNKLLDFIVSNYNNKIVLVPSV